MPVISAIVVAYNSRLALEPCLRSLFRQGTELEVIVVDNHSIDGTVDWLQRSYPAVRLLILSDNRGFGTAANWGTRQAQGRYVLVLNPDTEVLPGALQEMLRVAKAHPRAFITPKLLRPDGSINTCGNQMHYTGITTCSGLGEDAAAYRGIARPFLLSGAAILARRDAWLDVGGFDEQFFLYMEDADLSLRARLKGYDLLCAADAAVTHCYELKMNPLKFYVLERNRLLTMFKNFRARTIVRMGLGLFLTELATWSYAIVSGPAYVAARWRGYVWLWQHHVEWLTARGEIQSTRRVDDSSLVPWMTTALPFHQLVATSRIARLLELLTTPLYRWLRPGGELA